MQHFCIYPIKIVAFFVWASDLNFKYGFPFEIRKFLSSHCEYKIQDVY